MKSQASASWRRVRRAGLAGGVALAVGSGGLLSAMPAHAAEAAVTDAVFEWGINAESGSGAYAPGTCNFLSAGIAGDAGKSAPWGEPADLFKAVDGNTKILRPVKGGDPQAITWDNKCETSDGKKVNTRGVSSGNYAQISGGTGKVDPDSDTGTIEWKGSFTVVYYSGYTYWTISNPKLEVTNGHGKMTGTLSGYGADMDDPTKWEKLPKTEATIADFSNSTVDLTDKGFTVTPDYAGVDSGQADQNKSKDGWGSFPKSWVDFNVKTGQTQYWYTSGGAADARKTATPISVSFTGTAPQPDTPPTDDPPLADDDEPAPPKEKPKDTSGPGAATMFWAINAETSAGGFAPGTCNFPSAGVSPDNGGTQVWDSPGTLYKPSDGNVRIEKPDGSGTFRTATWDNRCTDRKGQRVVATDPKSQHESRVVIEKGEASTDNGIEARWTGGFTIVFYSGMTYWSISDPQLTVNADGTGQLTGTASGYGADMDNLDKWERLAPETITMATFTGVDVKKAIADGGFTVTPDFADVKYSAPGGGAAQDRSVKGWGSFPKSWVDFNQKTGQHSYWYTSGGIADARKKAAPLTIALSGEFQPPAESYAGASESGAGTAGSGTGGAAGQTSGQSGAKQSGTPVPTAQTDDHTAFAPAAADARASNGITGLSWRDWTVGGGIAAGAIAATGGLGWFLRRQIGLDPSTWV